MTEMTGLPRPPAVGDTALKPGTFDGVCVFVTGAGTGLGKGIASEFARLGADVVIASRKPEHLEAGREAIEAIGARVLTVECDIRDADSIAAAFDAAEATFGLPGVLVNNAANDDRHKLEDVTPAYWDNRMNVNLRHLYFASQGVVAGMKRAGGGSICMASTVNVSL